MFQNPLGEMVQKYPSVPEFRQQRRARLFHSDDSPSVAYPIQHVEIDWERLKAKRPLVLKTIDAMPTYLIKPEVLALLEHEKDPMYRLILDLMWTTGARISEVLALKKGSFVDDGYDFGVILKTLKQNPGRPKKTTLRRSPKRYVPINDAMLCDRVQSYLYAGHFRQTERIFTVTRQSVNRHIHTLVDEEGGAPFAISCHTFRHYADNLVMPSKIVFFQ